MERKIGLFSRRALANASSPHGIQSTGFCACWRRYGDFSRPRRFAGSDIAQPIALLRKAKEGWFTNRPFSLVGRDSVEPTNVGGACAPRLCESIRHSGIGSTESRPTKKFIGGLEAAATLRKKVPPPTLY